MDLLLSEVAARTQITKLNNTNRKWAMVVILCTSVFASLQMVHVLLPRRSPSSHLRAINKPRLEKHLVFHLNVTFPHLPCPGLAVEVMDVMMGRHPSDLQSLRKTRIAAPKKGGAAAWRWLGPYAEAAGWEAAVGQFRTEGCNLQGQLTTNSVPGSFHIGAKANKALRQKLLGGTVDVRHVIHEWWVGNSTSSALPQPLPEELSLDTIHPLNDLNTLGSKQDTQFEYFVDLIPTLIPFRGKEILLYQATSNNHEKPAVDPLAAAVAFRYQISAMAMRLVSGHGVTLLELAYALLNWCAALGALVGCWRLWRGHTLKRGGDRQ
eukprot:EG_transcript_16195